MGFRRQPTCLYGLALALFCVTAMLPLALVLGKFLWDCVTHPASMADILIDWRQGVLLGRSLGVAGLATLLAFVLGLAVAFPLAAHDLPWRRFFWVLVLVPLLIPPYVMAGAWIHLLSPGSWVNRVMVELFGPSAVLKVQSFPGCAWCLGISFFPVIAFIVATGLCTLDRDLQDLARLNTDGWGVFWHSTLPQIAPHLTASICLVLVFVLVQYSVPSLLGINTYPVEIFAQFSAFYNETAAVATGIPLVAAVALLILVQRWAMGSRDYVRLTPSSEAGAAVTLGRRRYLAVAFLVSLFVVAVMLPFGHVLARAGGPFRILSTLKGHMDWILYTSMLALAASVISTGIAFSLGQVLAHGQGRAVRVLDILCWLPVAIPGTVVGLGFLRLSTRVKPLQQVDTFGLLLLLAYVGMFSAFAIRVFQAAYRRTDPHIDEAATLDCPHWYQKCWLVDLRLQAPAIAVSMIMVFVLVVGELNATVLLVPPGKVTLAVSIDNLLHYGASTSASALCLIEAGFVVAITLGSLGLADVVGRRMSRR